MRLDLAPGTRLEKYAIERLLGVGGMGSVWLARHEGLGSLHAIKLLQLSSPEIDARLRQEGQLQARLSHPNVVRVTDTVEIEGRPGLVLEYVEGRTLAELLAELAAQERVLSLAEVDELACGILRGVMAAHDRGWIHRDLKPGNVLLQETDGGLLPKVTDFGLAKILDGDEQVELDTSGQGLGTRRYMPLEQLLGLKPDQRFDVFSLGAVLYELATGRPAFPTVEAWEEAMRTGRHPEPPREDLPERMRAAIAASLCEREGRAASARELYRLWTSEIEPLPRFRPEILHAARRSEPHLQPERLLAEQLTPSERAHLEGCGRCQGELRRARAFAAEVGSTVSGSAPPAVAEPARASRRWAGGTLAGVALGGALGLSWAAWRPQVPEPRAEIVLAEPPAPNALPAPAPAPALPEVRQVAPPRRRGPPGPVRRGTLIVNTMSGPMGRFRVDGGALQIAGPLRPQELAAGEHRVEIFAADGSLEWEGLLSLAPDERAVFCWDLRAHARCRK